MLAIWYNYLQTLLLSIHIEQKLDTYDTCCYITVLFTQGYIVNIQTIMMTVSPLSLWREPSRFKHLCSSPNGEGDHLRSISQKWFSLLQSWDSTQISDFISGAFHLDHMVFSCRKAGRGSKIFQRNIYKLTFAVGFSINQSCLYPWVCLTTSEITQVNPLRLPSPPRAVICLWDTLLLPCFSSSVTFKEGNPESLSKSKFLSFITADIRVR